ncbi:hypothetical protein [Commensalibacter papalotli (ex Botero et al. 2024)]|uniref:Halovibrin HvnA n=1 Tax=Commensalibacter papalotli (ex Botero et al. 2024) TaxID=2972766 RepID=A0ABN8W7Q4_9PROT|nr:hypothetical protein [Commensalibacter papalotli (ex Botero et al. 2024)]CAI3932216.1 unnamed protein product [Commensalibacter papalotli (ex Botero et al. 2024)]CAI3946462.1 unnamed protein product [Commensalibacter papalotli (ex Botero et al. 2024)]
MKLFKITPIATLFVAILSVSGNYQARASTADDLNANYSKIVNNCGSSKRPAFLCSGVMIRFTGYSNDYNAWDPSPASIKRQGVSFTYIRKDIPARLGFGGKLSGVIYYPNMLAPLDKVKPEITCAFPTDAWTDGRGDSCGRPDSNRRCQNVFAGFNPVTTAELWYQNYMSLGGDENHKQQYQCAFDMSIGSLDLYAQPANTADLFNQNLRAIQMYPNIGSGYNEIIVKPLTDAKSMPIQAFFYLTENMQKGGAEAFNMRDSYYYKTGIYLPVVRVEYRSPTIGVYFMDS